MVTAEQKRLQHCYPASEGLLALLVPCNKLRHMADVKQCLYAQEQCYTSDLWTVHTLQVCHWVHKQLNVASLGIEPAIRARLGKHPEAE